MKSRTTPPLFPLILVVGSSSAAQDPFAEGVRPTPWLTPSEERQAFELAPGYVIDLVASEPQIQKPMNLAFDERGRIWVTDTIEYPYAAPLDKPGRDSIKVLEDADGDGKAERITTFAGGLNIPIGILPYRGGAIAWSIPYIWHFKDADGDGKCDERVKLYGPMGFERDTHGMNNAFRRGFDGWIYACHGFNNETRVKGADGHEVKMQSGNVYRFRPDGSRVEQFTRGQVNPFGMCFDELGGILTADCHTRPITVLLRDGCYESFGRPHDGLGFVPEVMQHIHGSTANCGIVQLTGDRLPPEHRGLVLTGNVMTSRVNADRLEHTGTTPRAIEVADLVATKDPWFRPVDIQEGPDGAIYIADFYNRIIGHYEVPLTHPGRDRTSGRIWRLRHREPTPPPKTLNLAAASLQEALGELEHPVLSRRLTALDAILDRFGPAAAAGLRPISTGSGSPRARSLALWGLHRLGALDTTALSSACGDEDRLVRVHAARILADLPRWDDGTAALAKSLLDDRDPFARRAAFEAHGLHPGAAIPGLLLDAMRSIPSEDAYLRHAARIALRNQLRQPQEAFAAVAAARTAEADQEILAGVALAIESHGAAAFLVRHARGGRVEGDALRNALRHAARHVEAGDLDGVVELAEARLGGELEEQLGLLAAVQDGLTQRGVAGHAGVEAWGSRLAVKLLDSVDGAASAWRNTPVDGKRPADNPWTLQDRTSADGPGKARFLCSLPRGEQLTGVLRSPELVVPSQLVFFVAGHAGLPDRPAHSLNAVRLRAASGELLEEAAPPRNDVAQRVEWDLTAHAGKRAHLEVVDGDDGGAFAWLAVGRFDPPVVDLPTADPAVLSGRERAAAAIAGKLKLRALEPRLGAILTAASAEPASCEAAAQALIDIEPLPLAAALVPVVGSASLAVDLRSAAARAVASRDVAAVRAALIEAMKAVPARQQAAVAQALAGDKPGGELLLELVKAGTASPRLLQNRAVKERLSAAGVDGAAGRIAELTAGLSADSEARDKLLADRRKSYRAAETSAERGVAVFDRNCSACHQLAGKGKVLAPQLDGIGNRGLDRVLEDIIDPNRNVDVAFRTTTLVLKDGSVVNGLFRRREGKSIVLADAKGEENAYAEGDVEHESKGEISLMPENFGEVLPEAELADLLKLLLQSRGGG